MSITFCVLNLSMFCEFNFDPLSVHFKALHYFELKVELLLRRMRWSTWWHLPHKVRNFHSEINHVNLELVSDISKTPHILDLGSSWS
jgi:hypothetical protein